MDESSPRTLCQKIWDAHVVETLDDGTAIIAIDRHLLHEGVATYAFEGLRMRGSPVRRPDLTLGVTDHVVPTSPRNGEIVYEDEDARKMVADIEGGCSEAGIPVFSVRDRRQGIVHVVGPEQGFVLPGTVLVCGDSHTSTHGAFGAYAFGIGISEVEHVLATQTMVQHKPLNMRVAVSGRLSEGTAAKDLALCLMREVGVAGGTGHVVEYQGEAITSLTMEGRMTVCNMSIELGARAGMIAPDDTTFAYLEGRPFVPNGSIWTDAVAAWRDLKSDPGAHFDTEIEVDGSTIAPHVTWGTNPGQSLPIDAAIPDPDSFADEKARAAAVAAIEYMGLEPGRKMSDVAVDHVFIGSCTNGRIEDLRLAAAIARGNRVADGVTAWVVPGSGLVKDQAEREGLDRIFREAGFDWREPGCSMCLAMNGETLAPGRRSASTSNRNFEGRQGRGARTHLVSPATAAATAIRGRFTDPREFV